MPAYLNQKQAVYYVSQATPVPRQSLRGRGRDSIVYGGVGSISPRACDRVRMRNR